MTSACSGPTASPFPGAQRHRDCTQLWPGMGQLRALRMQHQDTNIRPLQSSAQRGSQAPSDLGVPLSSGRVAGTRSQRQRGQGRLKQSSPRPTAVSGCLLGRRRAVRRGGGPCPARVVRSAELECGVLRVHFGVRGVQGGVVEQRVPHFHFSSRSQPGALVHCEVSVLVLLIG